MDSCLFSRGLILVAKLSCHKLASLCGVSINNGIKPNNIDTKGIKMKYILIAGLLLSFSIQSNAQELPRDIGALKVLARKGNAEAQYVLGLRYSQGGGGVLEDDKGAIEWYRLAAFQGHPGAQFLIGAQYFLGEGAEKDFIVACAWWSFAHFNGKPGMRDRIDHLKRKMTSREIIIAQEVVRDLAKKHPRLLNR